MKNNTLKAMGIAIGAALSLMYATGIEAQASEETPDVDTGSEVREEEASEEVNTKEVESDEFDEIAKDNGFTDEQLSTEGTYSYPEDEGSNSDDEGADSGDDDSDTDNESNSSTSAELVVDTTIYGDASQYEIIDGEEVDIERGDVIISTTEKELTVEKDGLDKEEADALEDEGYTVTPMEGEDGIVEKDFTEELTDE